MIIPGSAKQKKTVSRGGEAVQPFPCVMVIARSNTPLTPILGSPVINRLLIVNVMQKCKWGDTFPNEIGTVLDSCHFIGRCIYIVFCHIMASRRLLPAKCFKKRIIEGNVRAYVMDTNEVLGGRLSNKFKGATEAIMKQYLRRLVLVVSATEEDENDAIEMFTWWLRYEADGEPCAELRQADGTVMAALRFKGMENLKKQVAELLSMARVLSRETLGALPPKASATLRIYYTDRTPKGYQAPGFYPYPEDPILRSEAQSIQIATMQTNFHGSSIVVQSVYIDDAYAVGLRLKDDMRFSSLNDSLNDSLTEETGVGDETTHGDDTLERISGQTVEQVESSDKMNEDTVSRRSGITIESNISKMTKLSLLERRSPPTGTASSRSASPDEMPSKHTRRKRQKEIYHVNVDPANTAPGLEEGDNISYDTPPAKKTPGALKVAKCTPQNLPKRGAATK